MKKPNKSTFYILLIFISLYTLSVPVFSQNYYEDSFSELKDSVYYNKVDNLLNIGQYDSLVYIAQEAFDYYYNNKENKRALYLFNICMYYPLSGPMGDTILQLIDNKIEFLKENTDTLNVHYATLLHIKSYGLKYYGRFEDAIPVMQNAVNIYEQVSTPILHLSSGYYNLAGLCYYDNRIMDSYYLYKKALIGYKSNNPNETKFFKRVKLHDAASAYLGIALAMNKTNQIELATAFDKKAYDIFIKYFPDSDVCVISMINLASDYMNLEDYNSAIKFATLSNDWITNHDAYDRFHDVIFSLHGTRGISYSNIEEYGLALTDFRELESHVLKNYPDDSLQLAEVYVDIAKNYSLQSNLDSALFYYDKALLLNPGSIKINASLAETYANNSLFQKAIKHEEVNLKNLLDNSPNYEDKVPVSGDFTDEYLGYKNVFSLSKYYYSLYEKIADTNNLYKSIAYANLCDTLMGKYRDATLIGINDLNLAKDYHNLAEVGIKAVLEAYSINIDTELLENYLKFLSGSTAYKLTAEVNHLNNENAKSKRQIELLQNIRSLTNQMQAISNNPDSLLENNIYEELVANRIEAFELSCELQKQEQSGVSNKLFSNISIANIQSHISGNEGIIAYNISSDHIYSLFIDSHSVKIASINKDEIFDNTLLNYYRGIKTASADFQEYASSMYDYLISPYSDEIISNNKLVIIPDGQLAQLPFEAFYNNRTNLFLIQETAISYNYSIPLWIKSCNSTSTTGEPNFVGFAPVFSPKSDKLKENNLLVDMQFRETDTVWRDGNHLKELPFSKIEVKEIAQMFSEKNLVSETFLYEQASEKNVKNNIAKFDIVHISTHGYSSSNDPELSGLFFDATTTDNTNITNDGFLYLGEMFTLPVMADLVVLSACKTGTGKLAEGEGALALPRGFIFAGVPNLVVSLWKIHDYNTKNLMVDFYANILSGDTYTESLQKAKIEQIQQGVLPMDWSGIILIGK